MVLLQSSRCLSATEPEQDPYGSILEALTAKEPCEFFNRGPVQDQGTA